MCIRDRDDVGEEMFFIIQGTVKIMSSDERTVIVRLKEGSFFGEIALLQQVRRTASVVAETVCVLYVLRKDDVDKVFQNYPELKKKLDDQAKKRVKELQKTEQHDSFNKTQKNSFSIKDIQEVDKEQEEEQQHCEQQQQQGQQQQGQQQIEINKTFCEDLDNSNAQLIQKSVQMLQKKYESGSEEKSDCLLYTSPSPRDRQKSRMPSSA
eukprot:TRINITY_DN10518_c0_g1_i2.p1 TRINITY_DN10518_c0_g1~~TRINITY_DN10518_c0_g1_i2.p1  ORF type:complete len:224 (-),score=57.81 TRINITY_DN10518_c0_g1_i2:11-637(-)